MEDVDPDGTFRIDYPYTSQGDSGLPIFERTKRGNRLVGCIGWFINRDGYLQTEKVANFVGDNYVELSKWKRCTIITAHCGSGKTRNSVPAILKSR